MISEVLDNVARQVATAATLVNNIQSFNMDVMEYIRPTLVGGLARLYRFNEQAERTLLGAYNPLANVDYDYENQEEGLVPDPDYNRVFVKNGYARFFNKPISTDGTAIPPASPTNHVRASNFIFKTANGFNRSAVFGDRDVQVNDVVKLSAIISTVLITHTTKVIGFVGETVASSVEAASAASTNAGTQSDSGPTAVQVSGTPLNYVTATGDGTYDSIDDGAINRVYTVTVTQSSAGGDPTTALLRVRSSDGLDDQDNVVPSAYTTTTAIGTKGAEIEFDTDSGRPVDDGVSADDLVAGQEWTLTCAQAFTAPTATSGGTYTGTRDLTYIVTVTLGALGASGDAEISVTSSDGTDISGPTIVTNLGDPIDVGSFGATITFSGGGSSLRKGDIWFFEAVAPSEAEVRTLVLRDNVPALLLTEDCNLELLTLVDDLEIAPTRTEPSEAVNWSSDLNGISVEPNIHVHPAPSFTNAGDPVYFPLVSGDLYLHHRFWVINNSEAISVYTEQDALNQLGSLDIDNPLGFAAYFALRNTATSLLDTSSFGAKTYTDRVIVVPLTGTPDDVSAWEETLDAVVEETHAYNIVPLTGNKEVHDILASKVKQGAADGNRDGFFKRAILPITIPEVRKLIPGDDSVPTMTITSGDSGNNLLTGPANIGFLDLEVRKGDKVRINYFVNSLGEETYDTFTVREVLTNNTLYLEGGPVAPISVAIRAELWRTLNVNDREEYVGELVDEYDSSKVYVCVSDKLTDSVVTLPDFAVASAVAGLMGSVASQQGLKGAGVSGFEGYTRANVQFLTSQLKSLGERGALVVVRDNREGFDSIYIRNAWSTDTTSVESREEMVVRNKDAVWFEIQKSWEDLRGVGNLVDAVQDMLQARLDQTEAKLKGGNTTRGLGPPAVALRIRDIQQIPGMADALDINVEMVGPYPLNTTYLNLQLV